MAIVTVPDARRSSLLARTLLLLAAIPLAYLVAAAIGAAIPRNAGWREPAEGVTIYVASNGVHTGLLLPVRAAGVDWSSLVKPSHLADPRYAGTHLWFGWGERQFYLETPTWADVRPSTLLRALLGSDQVLMHVDHVVNPLPDPATRPVTLSEAQYHQLSAVIRASFADARDPRPIPGYGPADVFYEARGHYDGVRTCNQWTGATLAAAGVRIGAWTPTSAAVMQWF